MEIQVSNLPAIRKIKEVGIPTKRLNVTQHKQYREYADTVCANVANMLKKIKERILSNIRIENTDKILEKLASKLKVDKIIKEFTDLQTEIMAANIASGKLAKDYERKIEKLQMEKDNAISNYQTESLVPLMDKLDAHIEKVRENEELDSPYAYSPKIVWNKDVVDDEDDDEEETSVSYPIINMHSIFRGTPTRQQYIDSNTVREELKEYLDPAEKEFELAELKLSNMEEKVKEIMMFDEERMNEAFDKLFQFRDSIQEKYLEVVRNIKTNGKEEEK